MALITFEWDGAQGGSESVRFVDEVEDARNLCTNPRADTTSGWGNNHPNSHDTAFVDIADHPLGITRALRSRINPAGTSADSLSLYNTGNAGPLSEYEQIAAQGIWVKSNVPAVVTNTGTQLTPDVWTYTVRELGAWSGIVVRPLSSDDLPDAETHVTGCVVCLGDTEEEAFDKVRTYFDGDSTDHYTAATRVYHDGDWHNYPAYVHDGNQWTVFEPTIGV